MGIRLIRSKSSDPKKTHHGFMTTWYAQMRVNGKLKDFPLPVKVEGIPPASGSLKDKGDKDFEKSRKAAEEKLKELRGEKKTTTAKTEVHKYIYEEKTGRKYDEDFPPLSELGARVIEGGGEPRWMDYVKSIFDRFAVFAGNHGFTMMIDIDSEFAKKYAKHLIEDEHFKWETIKKHLSRLSSAFAEYLPSGYKNPFKGIVKKTKRVNHKIDTEPTKRKPLSDEELAALFVEARKMGEGIYNIAACAANTGMRIKDVCLLKWEDVDLRDGLIRCKTHKTGARVTIPIMNELADVLDGANTDTAGSASEYVFPAMAERYIENQTGIVYDGKLLFARALASLDTKPEPAEANAPELTDDEKNARIRAAMDTAKWNAAKRERVRKVYGLYRDGLSYRDIESETGIPRQSISGYFAELERLAGVNFRKGENNGATRLSDKAMIRKYTREKKSSGKSNLSIYSWHSLRNNFVVRAFAAGVSNISVQRIVGHTTFKQTMDYCNPTDKISAMEVKLKMDKRYKGKAASNQMSAMLQMFAAMPPEDRAAFVSMMKTTPLALNK